MPIHFWAIEIADPEVRRTIREALERKFSDVTDHFTITIKESKPGDKWELKVDGPLGERSLTLYRDRFEHQPDRVSTAVEPMLKQLRAPQRKPERHEPTQAKADRDASSPAKPKAK